MSSFRMRRAVVVTAALVLLGAVATLEASAATKSAATVPAFCKSGQKTTKAKPCAAVPVCALGEKTTTDAECTANPLYARSACAALVPLLQPLAPGVSIVGSGTNSAAPANIDCWFQANGKRQAFSIQTVGGAIAKTYYAEGLAQYTGYAADPTSLCPSGAPQASVQPVSGLGDKAFAWQSCGPMETGFLLSVAIHGSTYAYVLADPSQVSPSLGQLDGVVRELLKFK